MVLDSYISANNLVDEIAKEDNNNFPITKKQYSDWINSVEQLLYSDVIKMERSSEFSFNNTVNVSDIPYDEGFEDVPRPHDFVGVFLFTNGTYIELEKTNVSKALGSIQDTYSYYIDGNTIHIIAPGTMNDKLVFVRVARPVPKRVIGDKIVGNISVPPEFVDMIRCKLRGEKYRLMNEDELCSKWIGEYNNYLESFKLYVEARRSRV